MKTKLLVPLCVAVAIATAIALAEDKQAAKPDTPIDKLLEQQEQKIKNQEEFLKRQQDILQRLNKIDEQLIGVRRKAGSRSKLKK